MFWAIVLSAILHAGWNFLVKRSEDPAQFLYAAKLVEVLIFLVPFLWVFHHYPYGVDAVPRIIVAAILVYINYRCLALAYHHIPLSIAYPISRSTALCLPILGYLTLGERIDELGLLAIILVGSGTIALGLLSITGTDRKDASTVRNLKGLGFSLAAMFSAATYTVWDKVAIQSIHPFAYFYSYTVLVTAGFSWSNSRQHRSHKLVQMLRKSWASITMVAIANTFSYLLILYALTRTNTSYAAALRQLSLVAGLLLSWRFLGESLSTGKVLATAIIVLGASVVLLANG